MAAHGGRACAELDELLALEPDVVIVATTHDQLAPMAERALRPAPRAGGEAGRARDRADRAASLAAAERAGRRRQGRLQPPLSPGASELAAEVHSGAPRGADAPAGALRPRRPARYDREWRAQPRRSGGGELIDQGMHLLDLTHWLAGPLPLHSALLRTHFWDTGGGQRGADPRGRRRSPRALGDAPRDLDRVEEHVLDRGLLPDREAAGRRPGALLRDADAAHLPHAPGARPARCSRSAPTGRGSVVDGRVGALRGGARHGAPCSAASRRPLRLGPGRGRVRVSPEYADIGPRWASDGRASAGLAVPQMRRTRTGFHRSASWPAASARGWATSCATRRSPCSRSPASRSCCISCGCWHAMGRHGSCSASATSAS